VEIHVVMAVIIRTIPFTKSKVFNVIILKTAIGTELTWGKLPYIPATCETLRKKAAAIALDRWWLLKRFN